MLVPPWHNVKIVVYASSSAGIRYSNNVPKRKKWFLQIFQNIHLTRADIEYRIKALGTQSVLSELDLCCNISKLYR